MVYSPFKTSQDPAISPSDCTERSCTTHCQTSPLLPYLLLHQGTSPFVLFAPWIGGSVMSLGLGQPWPCLDLLPLLPLLFGIAFHPQLVLLSYHPIFLRPYHFLKFVSFLGANRTKSASVCLWLLRGAI